VAIMGSATASGENRATQAIAAALTSPLLNNNDITGARSVLLNITSGTEEITMDEISEITDYVVSAASRDTTLIWGMGSDESLKEKISVTIIATGFKMNSIPELYLDRKEKHKVPLRETRPERQRAGQHSNVIPQQGSLEFGVRDKEGPEEYILMEQSTEISQEEREKKMAERVRNLKETHEKLRDRGYLASQENEEIEELENIPAFVRKNISIDQQKHSEDQQVSRYRLTEDDEGGEGPKLKPDNSYLHDNVD
jgi:cell division protein FtsZ